VKIIRGDIMGTTAEKLAKIEATKADIKQSIIEKGVSVPADATFASYPGYIDQISTGIEPTGNIELQQQTGTNVTQYATASVKSGAVNTPATTKQQSQPSITVSSSGLITASVAATSVSVTPNVSTAGWVSSGTAGTITMSASSNTQQLTTKAATTYTPGTTDQTMASGQYLTGVQTIKGSANLVSSNILNGVQIFNVTGNVEFNSYYTGTSAPSSSLGSDGDIYLQM